MPEGRYRTAITELRNDPKRWLVTGVAGFIGSNLAEELLREGQDVVGLDNFSTGRQENLDAIQAAVGNEAWERFKFIEGDIRDLDTCKLACERIDLVLHQAALGSVPRSIVDPVTSNAVNVDGFIKILLAAKEQGVGRVVYASSSAVYGDIPSLPKVESEIGTPLSPYAVTKRTDELYAAAFATAYAIETIGLRYFNVFGPRQDPAGPYAAVIPLWVAQLLRGEQCVINGDGETSRDFCFVANVVQANLLAATARSDAANQVYNIAAGAQTTLNELHMILSAGVTSLSGNEVADAPKPTYASFRAGDVRHSLADISRARSNLGYEPEFTAHQGFEAALSWYYQTSVAQAA